MASKRRCRALGFWDMALANAVGFTAAVVIMLVALSMQGCATVVPETLPLYTETSDLVSCRFGRQPCDCRCPDG